MDNELLKRTENNDIVDHLEAIREIISRKCARCNGNGCMGCLFDSIDSDMFPALLDKAFDLMSHLPNDRHDVVRAGQKRHQECKAKWNEIRSEKSLE
jgi:hypothetical protein